MIEELTLAEAALPYVEEELRETLCDHMVRSRVLAVAGEVLGGIVVNYVVWGALPWLTS